MQGLPKMITDALDSCSDLAKNIRDKPPFIVAYEQLNLCCIGVCDKRIFLFTVALLGNGSLVNTKSFYVYMISASDYLENYHFYILQL